MPGGNSSTNVQWRFGAAIGQISRRWRARLDTRMARFGLTEARWLAVLHLARGGDGLTQKDLAARIGVEGPTLVRTLDWLEREGFVARRAVPHDRRAKTVHLTPKSKALRREIEAEAMAVRAEILGAIPETEIAACLAVLEHVAGGLGAAPPAEEVAHGYRAA